MKQKTRVQAISALIALIISLGLNITPGLFEDELKDYYRCDLTAKISEFKGGISGTAYSGYPFIDSRKSAQKCGTSDNKGSWISLSQYAKDNGIDPYDLIVPKNTPSTENLGRKVRCNYKGCVAI